MVVLAGRSFTCTFVHLAMFVARRRVLASRRSGFVVVLAGRSHHRAYCLLWLWLVVVSPFALAVRSFVQKALLAERTVTVSSGVQNVIFSAWFLGGLFQSHQSRHRTSRPPQLWAPRLADRFRCRQVHHDACPLQSALAPTCATLLIPIVQDTSGTAFSTPLAATFLQSLSFSS